MPIGVAWSTSALAHRRHASGSVAAVSSLIRYEWREALTDAEVTDLTQSHGGDAVAGTRVVRVAVAQAKAAGCE